MQKLRLSLIRRRIVFICLAFILAAVCAASIAAAEPERFRFTVRNGKLDQAQSSIRVLQDAAVEFHFEVDEPIELHVHGYDHLITAEPGTVATTRFKAAIAGRFPVEAHRYGQRDGKPRRKHIVLFYLEVYPR